jgi:hypothetical protein
MTVTMVDVGVTVVVGLEERGVAAEEDVGHDP